MPLPLDLNLISTYKDRFHILRSEMGPMGRALARPQTFATYHPLMAGGVKIHGCCHKKPKTDSH